MQMIAVGFTKMVLWCRTQIGIWAGVLLRPAVIMDSVMG